MLLTELQLAFLLIALLFFAFATLTMTLWLIYSRVQERKALGALIAAVCQQEDERRKHVMKELKKRPMLNDKLAKETCQTLLQAEKNFYQLLVDIFGAKATAELGGLHLAMNKLLDEYLVIKAKTLPPKSNEATADVPSTAEELDEATNTVQSS